MSDACVIVAAGQGARMGGIAKALLDLHGRSFLECIASRCRKAAIDEIVVVVAPPHGRETQDEAMRLNLATVENARPELGMGSSVAVGFEFAVSSFDSDACWLWPVDHPRVELATLHKLAAYRSRDSVVIPSYADRGGHPVLVGRDIWPELAACSEAEQGARTIFHSQPRRVQRVVVSDRGIAMDIDRPADLARLQ